MDVILTHTQAERGRRGCGCSLVVVGEQMELNSTPDLPFVNIRKIEVITWAFGQIILFLPVISTPIYLPRFIGVVGGEIPTNEITILEISPFTRDDEPPNT